MSTKLVTLFARPEDPDAFMRHYHEVHLPLARQIPGLQRLEVARVTGDAMGGESPTFLVSELYFADDAAFQAAMQSEENRAAGRDLRSFARGLTTFLVCSVEEGGA